MPRTPNHAVQRTAGRSAFHLRDGLPFAIGVFGLRFHQRRLQPVDIAAGRIRFCNSCAHFAQWIEACEPS
jgi:hypothetical protein